MPRFKGRYSSLSALPAHRLSELLQDEKGTWLGHACPVPIALQLRSCRVLPHPPPPPRPVSPKHCRDPVSRRSLLPRGGLGTGQGRLKEHKDTAGSLGGFGGGVPRDPPKLDHRCCWGHRGHREPRPAFLCPSEEVASGALRGARQTREEGHGARPEAAPRLPANGVRGLGVCRGGGSGIWSPL